MMLGSLLKCIIPTETSPEISSHRPSKVSSNKYVHTVMLMIAAYTELTTKEIRKRSESKEITSAASDPIAPKSQEYV